MFLYNKEGWPGKVALYFMRLKLLSFIKMS